MLLYFIYTTRHKHILGLVLLAMHDIALLYHHNSEMHLISSSSSSSSDDDDGSAV